MAGTYPKMLYKDGKLSQDSKNQVIVFDADHEAEQATLKFLPVDMSDPKAVEKKQKEITLAVNRRRERVRAMREEQRRQEEARKAAEADNEDDME